jgi:NAD(P)H-dependent FMN reductase
MPLNFLTLYGSVRTERQSIKFARFLDAQFRKRGHASTLIDPLQYPFPLLDKMYKEYPKGAAPEPLETVADFIRRADGFLIVSGEYNHGIPPVLKNMLDHFLEEWFWRPSVDRLLLGRGFWRCARRDATSRHSCRARNAKHLVNFSDAPSRYKRHDILEKINSRATNLASRAQANVSLDRGKLAPPCQIRGRN